MEKVKKSLTDKIMEFINGGDKQKVSRFQSKVEKFISKQISMRKDRIESLKDKIVDAKEALTDTVKSIDLDKIKSTDTLENYIPDYYASVTNAKEVIESLNYEIEVLEAEIVQLEENAQIILE